MSAEISAGMAKAYQRQGVSIAKKYTSIPSYINRVQLKARELAAKEEIMAELGKHSPAQLETIRQHGFSGFAMFISDELFKRYYQDANKNGIVTAYINQATKRAAK